MDPEHTPTPWRVYGRANKTSNFGNWRARICVDPNHSIATIAYCLGGDKDESEVAEANAAFIVRACNAHDALVDALESLFSIVADCDAGNNYGKELGAANRALKMARGES